MTDNCDSTVGACSNTPGGYTCGCITGYSLGSDLRACSGKNTVIHLCVCVCVCVCVRACMCVYKPIIVAGGGGGGHFMKRVITDNLSFTDKYSDVLDFDWL